MSIDRFASLRDRGTELWTQIEAKRLEQEDRVASGKRWNISLSVIAAFAGVVAGTSGTELFGSFGKSGTLITVIAGFVAALAATLNPVLGLSDRIQSASQISQKLQAIQDEIRNHIYRMQTQNELGPNDMQLFFDQRSDAVRRHVSGGGTKMGRYQVLAQQARDANNFPKLTWLGEQAPPGEDDIQTDSGEIIAFGRGAA